ncbi:MAG: hypothetical protein QE487_01950 [Fluviicola sp.]|nr:hypothetical protein [Fluviicola sp.]
MKQSSILALHYWKLTAALFLSFVCCFSARAQITNLDSIRITNELIDKEIEHLFSEADSLGKDIVILRKYNDSLNLYLTNYCRIIYEANDSCSLGTILTIDEHYSISFISFSRVRVARIIDTCETDFPNIERDLMDYFTREKPPLTGFSHDVYTLIGIINGKYLYETFEEAFLDLSEESILHEALEMYLGLLLN